MLFFDEVEALAQRRQFGGNDKVNTVVSVLLSEMDGINASNDGLLFLGATNLPWSLDSAFRRPGRFDRSILVPPPDRIARMFVLRRLLNQRPHDETLDLDPIVERTSGYSGADHVLQHFAFQSVLDVNCPKDASNYDLAIAAYQSVGDQAQVLRFQSQAAFRRCNFAEAIHLGDQSRQAGYRETSFASYMAMICSRSFRFGKSRQYARLALHAQPGHPVATELLVLTRLVWFPPFLLAHALLFVLAQVSCNRLFGALVLPSIFFYALLVLLFVPVKAEVILSTVILMILYCAYSPIIGKIAAFVYRNGAPTVRLSGY